MMKQQLSNKRQRTTLEVRIMFEASRSAERWLHQAYEEVMPITRRPILQRTDFEALSLPLVKGTKQQRGGTKK